MEINVMWKENQRCKSLDELEGLASGRAESRNSQSLATLLDCYTARKLDPINGLDQIRKIYRISRAVAREYANTASKYLTLITHYPRLTKTFFLRMYGRGIPLEKAKECLNVADQEGMSVVRFTKWLEDEVKNG